MTIDNSRSTAVDALLQSLAGQMGMKLVIKREQHDLHLFARLPVQAKVRLEDEALLAQRNDAQGHAEYVAQELEHLQQALFIEAAKHVRAYDVHKRIVSLTLAEQKTLHEMLHQACENLYARDTYSLEVRALRDATRDRFSRIVAELCR